MDSSLSQKYKIMVEVSDCDKHSSLLTENTYYSNKIVIVKGKYYKHSKPITYNYVYFLRF